MNFSVSELNDIYSRGEMWQLTSESDSKSTNHTMLFERDGHTYRVSRQVGGGAVYWANSESCFYDDDEEEVINCEEVFEVAERQKTYASAEEITASGGTMVRV